MPFAPAAEGSFAEVGGIASESGAIGMKSICDSTLAYCQRVSFQQNRISGGYQEWVHHFHLEVLLLKLLAWWCVLLELVNEVSFLTNDRAGIERGLSREMI